MQGKQFGELQGSLDVAAVQQNLLQHKVETFHQPRILKNTLMTFEQKGANC